MHIDKFIDSRPTPFFSFELIPPARGGSINDVYHLVDRLMPFSPSWIDVTNHAADSWFEETADGSWKRHIYRKRPGTLGLCAALKYHYKIETVPHILCTGFTKEETEDALIELSYLEISNLLVVRGDNVDWRITRPGERNKYAVDLVRQVTDMNNGKYAHDLSVNPKTDFCIGVAGYPEKHFESPNINWDLEHLKSKIEAGAKYIVTQMFFDNRYYYNFLERCRDAGITVPIIPGLKVLTRKSQLTNIPRNFHVDIPENFSIQMQEAKTRKEQKQIGIEHAIRQGRDLLEHGVPGLHMYVTSDSPLVARVMHELCM
jgi:methylenetetrahydrofolate reductase (NADPH)